MIVMRMIANDSSDHNEDKEEDYDADDAENKEILMMQVMMQGVVRNVGGSRRQARGFGALGADSCNLPPAPYSSPPSCCACPPSGWS